MIGIIVIIDYNIVIIMMIGLYDNKIFDLQFTNELNTKKWYLYL